MHLDRRWIESRIPHHGRMCLLDAVLEWDEQRIACRTTTHHAADHPMRSRGRLGVACGIEYAAQTMAVHGALTASSSTEDFPQENPLGKPMPGLLASLRGVRMHVRRLDDIEGDLICCAMRSAGIQGSALYEFEVRSATSLLLEGRATVVLDAGGRSSL